MKHRIWWIVILVALGAAGVWWGARGRRAPTPGEPGDAAVQAWQASNVLLNGSFEQWRFPWETGVGPFWREAAFDIAPERALLGRTALRLDLVVPSRDIAPLRSGVVQECRPDHFPQYLSIKYLVERWAPDLPYLNLYLKVQVVGDVFGTGQALSELRYILEGKAGHWVGSNLRTITFPARPTSRERWITFERDLWADFAEQYGEVPVDFEAVRLIFAVSCDERVEQPVALRVWGENCYLGLVPPPDWEGPPA